MGERWFAYWGRATLSKEHNTTQVQGILTPIVTFTKTYRNEKLINVLFFHNTQNTLPGDFVENWFYEYENNFFQYWWFLMFCLRQISPRDWRISWSSSRKMLSNIFCFALFYALLNSLQKIKFDCPVLLCLKYYASKEICISGIFVNFRLVMLVSFKWLC